MKQISKSEVYVAQRVGGKRGETPLCELPALEKRVREVEKCYGVRMIYCTYEPNKGNLLTMKCAEADDGETIPVAS